MEIINNIWEHIIQERSFIPAFYVRVAYIMKKCPIWKCLDSPDLWFDVKRWNKVKISDLNKIYREQLTREKSPIQWMITLIYFTHNILIEILYVWIS